MKTCVECGQSLPETSYSRAKDGRMHPRCKTCRATEARKRRKKKKDTRLDAIEADAVDYFCKAAKTGGANIPHTAEMVEVLMEYFGGVRGFGNVFMKQYYDSPPGGAHRTRMLETVARLTQANTKVGGAKKPLEMWTEEELAEEVQKRIDEAAMALIPRRMRGIPGRVIDEEAPAEDPRSA